MTDTAIKSFNPDGRPLLFPDPKELSDKLDEYFDLCDKGVKTIARNKKGEPVTDNGNLVYLELPKPYSVEGLAVHLKCSTETLRKYAKKPRFIGIVSHAFTRIHQQWVEHGLTGQFNPKIAALCLAANTKTYNVVKQAEQHNTLTIEDKLKQARAIECTVIETKAIEDKTDE